MPKCSEFLHVFHFDDSGNACCATTSARGNLSTLGEQYCLQFPNEQDIEQNEDDEHGDDGDAEPQTVMVVRRLYLNICRKSRTNEETPE